MGLGGGLEDGKIKELMLKVAPHDTNFVVPAKAGIHPSTALMHRKYLKK